MVRGNVSYICTVDGRVQWYKLFGKNVDNIKKALSKTFDAAISRELPQGNTQKCPKDVYNGEVFLLLLFVGLFFIIHIFPGFSDGM